MELAIRDMWQADCIDRIFKRMGDYGQDLTNAGKYLVSCLYNAPVGFNTDMSAFKAAL